MTRNIEEDQETLRREVEAHATTLESPESEVVGLKTTSHDSLQQTMQVTYEVRDHIVEQTKGVIPQVFYFC